MVYISFILTQQQRYPREALQFFAYTLGTIWTIQHSTVTLAIKDHWSHDLHDLTERILNFVTLYQFSDANGNYYLAHSSLLQLKNCYFTWETVFHTMPIGKGLGVGGGGGGGVSYYTS